MILKKKNHLDDTSGWNWMKILVYPIKNILYYNYLVLMETYGNKHWFKQNLPSLQQSVATTRPWTRVGGD